MPQTAEFINIGHAGPYGSAAAFNFNLKDPRRIDRRALVPVHYGETVTQFTDKDRTCAFNWTLNWPALNRHSVRRLVCDFQGVY